MPAQSVSVNLLDQPEFQSSSIAQLFNWAITYGRYIMIGTEVIVLLAFISRFSLDRKLTDLREEISQKKIILEANQGFEDDFKQIQSTMQKVKGLLTTQDKPLTVFSRIIAALPEDVTLKSYKNDLASVELQLLAGTTEGFSLFLNRLQNLSVVGNINVTDIRKDQTTGTAFTISASIR